MWDSHNNDPCSICVLSRNKKMLRCDGFADACLDKENIQSISPVKSNELSMYDSGSTLRYTESQVHNHCSHRHRRPLVEHNSNSQDSGYHGDRCRSYQSPTKSSESFGLNSLCSMEDEFLDFTDIEPLEKQQSNTTKLPQDFNKLITNPLIQEKKNSPNDTIIRPLFRRALSLQTPTRSSDTPNSSRVRTSLFKGDDECNNRPFKRTDPPSKSGISIGVKRSRMFDEDDDEEASVPIVRPVLQRPFSATEESIMCAVQRSSTEPDLIGDFSKNFCLPLTRGKHQDLKAITSHTLSRLMDGEFNEIIASFKVIDCRYPYEFEGGHIKGAVNIYTKEQCIDLLKAEQIPNNNTNKRHILVFHCEFSSERGPNLYRFLRKEDRQRNETAYPNLHYPEIYLLEGGYKNFFENFSQMCVPVSYKEMLHPDHEEDLKHFRQKSKTWNCDWKPRTQQGRNFKRLGHVTFDS